MYIIFKLWVFIILCLYTKASKTTDEHVSVTVYGPGLNPDNIIMPGRYFFINFNITNKDRYTYLSNNLDININGKSKTGHCRVWVNKLNRKNGTFIVRYKTYESCYDFNINVLYKEKHIGKSPYFFSGPIYADQCYCPESNMETWLKQYGCTGDYKNILEDLKPFKNVNMQNNMKKILAKYHLPESTSFCHYVVKNNEVYRKCYGKHVGFNMFADNILLFLGRKVVLPDIELVINLGDWPLVRSNGEIVPIFSWCGSDDTSDIVMPTYDITESTLENMGRVTLDILSVQNVDKSWSDREPQAFWRGRDSRMERLKLIDIARQYPKLFNASLTNFFFYRDKESQYGPKQPHVSFYKFFDYKYQINVDGTVAAYRFPYLLAGGGLVFKQQSPYYEHFYSGLKEWEHFVPVKRDLSDLVSQIKWAIDHDEEAQTIARNAQIFANDHLLPQHIICYHAVLFQEWSKRLDSEVIVSDDMERVSQSKHSCECRENNHGKDEL